ncbi:hypothetical protein [Amycolatopsis sp.]|uniref:hypothetical protein n=1 Tax=Amycolatopsis sp. TaxID=37632 RepID=UPI00262E5EBF|nr:hypothetical protein [Amycolatopsis sp.]
MAGQPGSDSTGGAPSAWRSPSGRTACSKFATNRISRAESCCLSLSAKPARASALPCNSAARVSGSGGDRGYLQELLADGILDEAELPVVEARPGFGRPFPHHPAEESLARFRYGMRTLPIMHAAGVKIVAGSDVAMTMPSPPSALLRELQLFAKAGLPAAEVVATATRHAAERIGVPCSTRPTG